MEHKKIEHVHIIRAAKQLAQSIEESGILTRCPYYWKKKLKYESKSNKENGTIANNKNFLPQKEDKIWKFFC